MASSAVGIDIGTRTITLAQVKLVKGSPTITNFGGTELPPDCVREGEILDTAAVAAALKDLVSRTGTRDKKVWLGVANQRVVVRQLDLPWIDPKERRQSLRYQVQEHLPIPVEEAEIDSHVVEEFTTEGGERFMRLLLVAGHRDMVNAHTDVATQAGLKPLGVDLNPFAVLRSMGSTSTLDEGNEVVIDVGAGVTDIVVHRGGTPTFVRILVLGGDDITGALSSGTNVSAEDAELTKRQLGTRDTSGDVAGRIIAERAGAFVDEVRSSLDYYQAQPGASRLTNVILTGGGAMLDGLADRLADAVRLPVEIGSVFDRLPVKGTDRSAEDLARVGPSLAGAVGLAMGGLE